MSGKTITIRIPRAWVGVDSAKLRHWLADFLKHPTPNLPPDPGGGDTRKSFSLPKRQVKVVSGLLDETESAALRRIIASRVNALPPVPFSLSLPLAASELLHQTVSVPRSIAFTPRRPVLALSTWIPGRSLEHQRAAASPARSATRVESTVSPESPGLLEATVWIGIALFIVWAILWLF